MVAGAAFVDELVIPTNGPDQMKIQLSQVEQWEEWSRNEVNNGKCGLATRSEQECSHLTINGKAITRLGKNETYKYLGIHIAIPGGMTQHGARLKADLERKIRLLQQSGLNVWTKVNIANGWIMPSMAYSFPANQ
jgi:hypothetical protein